ncbi:MAG: hypothetical protein SWX82_09220, partial [Cyanobacteriota bacterium]|nr:hypothetical protein [Cyanobacteriota bacterium]
KHDFLFNAKTAFAINDYIAIAQLTNPLPKMSLCEALEKSVEFCLASPKKSRSYVIIGGPSPLRMTFYSTPKQHL